MPTVRRVLVIAGAAALAVLVGVSAQASANPAAYSDTSKCHHTTVFTLTGHGGEVSPDSADFMEPFVQGVEGNDVNAMPVQYNTFGDVGSGVSLLKSMIADLERRCGNPGDTQVVIAGFSMGGGILNEAFKSGMNPKNLKAVVTFGAGRATGTAADSVWFDVCDKQDTVCSPSADRSKPSSHGIELQKGNSGLAAAHQFVNDRLS